MGTAGRTVANYGTILILFTLALGIAGLLWTLATVLGPKAMTPTKAQVFECGNEPLGETPTRVSVKFYVVALLFIVFDMEAVFLYPWAANFQWFVELIHASRGLAADELVVNALGEPMLNAAGQPLAAAMAQSLGWSSLLSVFTFVFILTVGLIYVWKKGALEWR